jgi:hypothetical protein
MDSQEVEQDGDSVDKEQQQLVQKPKKGRVVWTEELHNKFVEAHNKFLIAGGGNVVNHFHDLPLICG